MKSTRRVSVIYLTVGQLKKRLQRREEDLQTLGSASTSEAVAAFQALKHTLQNLSDTTVINLTPMPLRNYNKDITATEAHQYLAELQTWLLNANQRAAEILTAMKASSEIASPKEIPIVQLQSKSAIQVTDIKHKTSTSSRSADDSDAVEQNSSSGLSLNFLIEQCFNFGSWLKNCCCQCIKPKETIEDQYLQLLEDEKESQSAIKSSHAGALKEIGGTASHQSDVVEVVVEMQADVESTSARNVTVAPVSPGRGRRG